MERERKREGRSNSLAIDATLAGWPTATVRDGRGNGSPASRAKLKETGHLPSILCETANLAAWPTPMAGSPETEEYNAERDYRHPNAKTYAERGGGAKGEQLPNQVNQALSGWATPRATDIGRQRTAEAIAKAKQNGGSGSLEDDAQLTTGPILSPSPVPTANTAASPPARMVLNPLFSLWLQAYPAAWGCCGARAMLSVSQRRRRSSGRSLKRASR
jgi:hypothetical protein